MRKLIALSVLLIAMAAATSTAQAQSRTGGIGTAVRHTIRHHQIVPKWFVHDAECVHSHEAPTWRWSPSYHPGYSYWNGYFTGLQFLGSTWSRANALLHEYISPYTGNVRQIILHAYVIVRQDGGSWREWRQTAELCGLPTY